MTYFLLVFALSLPLWVLGAVFPREILPGVPLSSLMVLCPSLAAMVLVWREKGPAGAQALVRRAVDFSRIRNPVWYAPTFLLMPLIALAAYGVLRGLGRDLPAFEVPPALLAMTLMIVVAAVAEELGWSGYATPRLLDRMGVLRTGLVLGVVTALWHLIPLLQVGRTPEWAAWQMGNLVATRILIVWLFAHTGSVAATALCHATVNLSWQLFPAQGSHYDPRIVGLITLAVALTVVLAWSPPDATGQRARASSPPA